MDLASSASPNAAPPTGFRTPDFALRTRLALLLIAIGVVVQLAPAGPFLATASLLAGGILLIVSSQPFGRAHFRHATVGLVLAVGGLLGGFVYVLALPFVLTPAPTTSSQLPAWIQSVEAALSQSLLAAALAASVSALGLVLLTYSLQDRVGRVCLWLGLGLVIAVNLLEYFVLNQGLTTLLNEASSGGGLDVALLNTIATQLTWFEYLSLIPQAVFAGCYFLAETRIRRGLVPAATRSDAPV